MLSHAANYSASLREGVTATAPRDGADGYLHHKRRGLVGGVQFFARGSAMQRCTNARTDGTLVKHTVSLMRAQGGLLAISSDMVRLHPTARRAHHSQGGAPRTYNASAPTANQRSSAASVRRQTTRTPSVTLRITLVQGAMEDGPPPPSRLSGRLEIQESGKPEIWTPAQI